MSKNLSPRTALIVIDVQRAFDEWEAAGKRRNNPQALVRIVELLVAFRGSGMPIFHIRHEGTRPGSSFFPSGTGYPVKDEAREIEGEPVIVKRVNSAFIGTDLETPVACRRYQDARDLWRDNKSLRGDNDPHGRQSRIRRSPGARRDMDIRSRRAGW